MIEAIEFNHCRITSFQNICRIQLAGLGIVYQIFLQNIRIFYTGSLINLVIYLTGTENLIFYLAILLQADNRLALGQTGQRYLTVLTVNYIVGSKCTEGHLTIFVTAYRGGYLGSLFRSKAVICAILAHVVQNI